jgi:hypothetical protein
MRQGVQRQDHLVNLSLHYLCRHSVLASVGPITSKHHMKGGILCTHDSFTSGPRVLLSTCRLFMCTAVYVQAVHVYCCLRAGCSCVLLSTCRLFMCTAVYVQAVHVYCCRACHQQYQHLLTRGHTWLQQQHLMHGPGS